MELTSAEVEQKRRDLLDAIPTLARHRDAIFLPLGDMISRFQSSEPRRNVKLDNIFEFIRTRCSEEQYSLLQERHLSLESLQDILRMNVRSPEHKYLDLPFWIKGKFGVAKILNLESRQGSKLLDIGSGPGHFGLVCKYYGVDYLGLEIPLTHWVSSVEQHVFDDLCEYFGVRRKTLKVEAGVPISLGERFDILTCLMGNFSAFESRPGHLPFDGSIAWPWSVWAAFLSDAIDNVMVRSEFEIYMQVGREYFSRISKDIGRYAYYVDEKRCVFRINQTVDRIGLRKDALAGRRLVWRRRIARIGLTLRRRIFPF